MVLVRHARDERAVVREAVGRIHPGGLRDHRAVRAGVVARFGCVRAAGLRGVRIARLRRLGLVGVAIGARVGVLGGVLTGCVAVRAGFVGVLALGIGAVGTGRGPRARQGDSERGQPTRPQDDRGGQGQHRDRDDEGPEMARQTGHGRLHSAGR